ncbi:MAG: hypothetical protein K2J13_02790 [Clostridia bacterium]|nr:hypothetical protein [Clostridia bacterium]
MSNARKKALIAIQAIMVVLFVVAVLLGMGAKNVKAETVNGASDQMTAAGYVDGLMVNGNVSSTYDAKTVYSTQNSTPLSSADDVKAFLTTDDKKVRRWENGAWKDYPNITATIGYLYLENNANKDSIDFDWNGTLTNEFMKEGRTFDGAGKKIVLTANGGLNSNPWKTVSSIAATDTFITASGSHSDVDINGAFIGYIPAGTTVKNTNFVYSKTISGSQGTDGSGCGGFIAGFCSGVVDNCSVTVSGSFTMNKTASGSGTSISRNTYAFGGLVGVLAGNTARVSNSSVNHLGNLTVNVTAASKGYGRAWLGGIVGFMARSAKAYNLTTAGTGSLNSTVGGGSDGYSGMGIAVGCCQIA